MKCGRRCLYLSQHGGFGSRRLAESLAMAAPIRQIEARGSDFRFVGMVDPRSRARDQGIRRVPRIGRWFGKATVYDGPHLIALSSGIEKRDPKIKF